MDKIIFKPQHYKKADIIARTLHILSMTIAYKVGEDNG